MKNMSLSLWCFQLFALVQAYVNVAQNKPAYQEYQWNPGVAISDASNGVDGLKSDLSWGGSQCVISENEKQNATWWVNLTSMHSIHNITIYYRTENKPWDRHNKYTSRFLGFSVYVSNTTDILHGTLCYKDDNFTLDTIPAVFNTACPVHGQYVIYYNERLPGATYPSYYSQYAYNEICELEVYGCPATGCYGSNNTFPCPDVDCQYCQRETGTCERCKSGFKGFRCEKACDKGSFGSECNETCGHCRDVNQCSNINGTCLTGCDAGYQGALCITPCDRRSFGYNCKEKCGHCRDVNQCSNINGTCFTGCDAGYQGDLCKTPCAEEYFGIDCTKKCNSTCKGCNNVNGSCDSGCHQGWMGDYCHKVCDNNMFGQGCANRCGHCRNAMHCSHVNGSCLNGCDAGYKGNYCKEVCEFGYYGLDCKEECSAFCKKSRDCHPMSGYCKEGCRNGWQGLDCLKVSTMAIHERNWKSEFNGILSAFCISLFFNAITIAYFAVKRIRNSTAKAKQLMMHQSDTCISEKARTNDGFNLYTNETTASYYQELGEFKTTETLDTAED